ncbi:peptide MFS transporter [Aquimarina algicola]|uniref:Peptide MFS transporter n=1 Tax=Aquimarina algicola TaxID=2589995 RepID=A0A504JCH1_9FLAO|nr:peptide MFS transporter [Aquimarina algicola]TPN86125.1 peptide MFS transporter [Aquimarina algicola]
MSTLQDDAKVFSLLGHKPALFVLFFTEMWERFSYYGMRALFVLFLTSEIAKGGWAWSNEDALSLYGWYTGLVYLTPIFGGYIADKLLGYRKAVAFGALLMTLGHVSMALETPTFLYIGLAFLIIGNGLFKPNLTSIVSGLYDQNEEKKDGAYTIYYMGVNAGAFLGIMLCGYIGEKINWSFGFGLAGIFMFLGMLQFWFGRSILENVGLAPSKQLIDTEKNTQTTTNKIVEEKEISPKVQGDRYIVVGVLAFFTIFFWAAFEQAGGSMTIFASKYTNLVLVGNAANIFKIADTLITIIPLIIITWVLFKLFLQTFKKISLSNSILGFSFVIIWGIVSWKLYREFSADTTEVPASWFGILNSLFIISFAPLFSKLWESKYNPSAAVKFGLGLILLGLGFALLAFGAISIPQGAETAKVSMIWLILAYLFHTLGELFLSPVGLSYVSKLVPAKLIGLMFGIWYLAIFIGNWSAGQLGGMIDEITSKYSLSTFFLIFTIVPLLAGSLLILLNPLMKKLMHGVR